MQNFVDQYKKHPGPIQVTRRVKVTVPDAGKFTGEVKSTAPKLISRMVKLHYNWKYEFLRLTIKEIIERYNQKFRPTVHAKLVAAAARTAAAAAAAAASSGAGGSTSAA